MAEKNPLPMQANNGQQQPNQEGAGPGIILTDSKGREHVARFRYIIDNLKVINANLMEENAVLKSILREKGVDL